MNTKILSSILLTAFLLVFSISAVSAVTFTQTDNSQAVTISNATVLAPNSTIVTINLEDGETATVTGTAVGQIVTFTASLNYDYADVGKVYSDTANVTNGTASQSVALAIVKSFCRNGSVNDSDLELAVDISSDGDEDLEWAPLDTIQVDVSLDNNFDTTDTIMDMNNVMFDFALFDENGKDVTNDLTWISSKEDSFEVGDIDEGDSGDHTFEFQVAPDLEDGDYTLFIKAYPDTDEDTMCIDYSSDLDSTYFQQVSVTRNNIDDENMIAFEDITVEPSNASCGQSVSITAKAYNLGTDKQDAVKIKLYNKVLGVNQELVIENFRTTGDKAVDFSFDVPTNIPEGKYSLDLWAMHDYDKDDDKDDDVVDFDDDSFSEETDAETVTLKVAGNCVNSTKPTSANLTAEFSEDTPAAVAGKELVIEATITNTGSASTNYSVDVSGNSAWSTAKEIDPKTFTLSAGESKKVSIYFDVDSDAEGEKSFTIRVNHGAIYTDFPVSPFSVEKGFSFSKITDSIKNNWIIYTIVLVNIILILAIIIVIAKMAK